MFQKFSDYEDGSDTRIYCVAAAGIFAVFATLGTILSLTLNKLNRIYYRKRSGSLPYIPKMEKISSEHCYLYRLYSGL